MSEADNVRRYSADTRGIYEVWYTTWNDPKTGQGFWLRFVIESPVAGHGVPGFGDAQRGELWFARFDPKDPARTFGIHKRFADVRSSDAPFSLVIGDSELRHDRSTGRVAGGGHDVRWDLRWTPSAQTLRHYPDVMYSGPLGRAPTMVHAPNPRVPVSGTLQIDGETLVLDRAIAGQSHIWAKKHSTSWTWAHCTDFEGVGDGMFELIGAKLRRGPITTPNLVMVSLDFDGEQHRLNQYRHIVLGRGSWRTGRIELTARSLDVKIEAVLSCRPEQLVMAPYLDPDGTEAFCANTEIGDATITVSRRRGLGWKEYRRLEARGRMHFETGGPVRDPAVARPHVLVT